MATTKMYFITVLKRLRHEDAIFEKDKSCIKQKIAICILRQNIINKNNNI